MPDLVEWLGRGAGLLADQAVEADADDLPVVFVRDIEHLGVDTLDVGLLRRCAALLQIELQVREHLRRRERAQVALVAAVVGGLEADEDHLGDALERRCVEIGGKAGRSDGSRGGGKRPAGGGLLTRCVAACLQAPELCRPLVGERHRCLGSRGAGASELHAAVRRRRIRRHETAHQEAHQEKARNCKQQQHDDVAERGAEAEVAHQRGDAEASSEAGDRAEPRAARRDGRGRCGGGRWRLLCCGCGRARGHRFGRGPRRHAALHADGAAAADAARLGDERQRRRRCENKSDGEDK